MNNIKTAYIIEYGETIYSHACLPWVEWNEKEIYFDEGKALTRRRELEEDYNVRYYSGTVGLVQFRLSILTNERRTVCIKIVKYTNILIQIHVAVV